MRLEEVIGRNVRESRERRGLSMAALGALLEPYLGKPWSRQAVWSAEQGNRAFSMVDLFGLALALDRPAPAFVIPDGDDTVDLPGPEGKLEGPHALALLSVHGGGDLERFGQLSELIEWLDEVAAGIQEKSAFIEHQSSYFREQARHLYGILESYAESERLRIAAESKPRWP